MQSEYIAHIEDSISKANSGISKLELPLLEIEGMSGEATRHFYNQMCSMKNATYLEIGTWKGSTVCSAMYGNSATIVCIDNWSQFVNPDFGNVKGEFEANFIKYKGENNAVFIESDCYSVDTFKLPKFNIYMYDGDHSFQSHYNALIYYLYCMQYVFIYIVDDWNDGTVQTATYKAISDMGLCVHYKKELFTDPNEPALPRIYNGGCDRRPWANGCGVFVLQKSKVD